MNNLEFKKWPILLSMLLLPLSANAIHDLYEPGTDKHSCLTIQEKLDLEAYKIYVEKCSMPGKYYTKNACKQVDRIEEKYK